MSPYIAIALGKAMYGAITLFAADDFVDHLRLPAQPARPLPPGHPARFALLARRPGSPPQNTPRPTAGPYCRQLAA